MRLDVLIVLGGWLVQEPDGKWRTTNFSELDGEGNISGDRVRVVAAALLYKRYPNIKIIVSGSRGRLSHLADCPTLSAILKKELIELAVKPESIIEEDRSSGTYQQLKNSYEIAKKLRLSAVGIVSNEYHLQRIRAFLERIPGIYWPGLELISAEKIAIENDPDQWEQEIKTVYASNAMEKRIALEQKGVQDLKEGKYKLS